MRGPSLKPPAGFIALPLLSLTYCYSFRPSYFRCRARSITACIATLPRASLLGASAARITRDRLQPTGFGRLVPRPVPKYRAWISPRSVASQEHSIPALITPLLKLQLYTTTYTLPVTVHAARRPGPTTDAVTAAHIHDSKLSTNKQPRALPPNRVSARRSCLNFVGWAIRTVGFGSL
jgi:hypothetical protein